MINKKIIEFIDKHCKDGCLIESEIIEKSLNEILNYNKPTLNKILNEADNFKINLKDNKQTDYYGDNVLQFESTLRNVDEFKENIKKLFANQKETAEVKG
jgi:hypothetical protein